MVQDTKSPLQELSFHEDVDLPPPAYDSTFATGSHPTTSPGPSTARTGDDRTIPEHISHLFLGPRNAENLLGRNHVPSQELQAIEWRQRGKIIESWDPQLSDPMTLYDFIRARAMTPPKIKLRCLGMHQETLDRSGTVFENGQSVHKRAGETMNVVDFDFTIDLSNILDHPANITHIHLRAAQPDVPAHRGTHLERFAASYAPQKSRASHRPSHQGYETLLPSAAAGVLEPGRVETYRERSDRAAWNTYRAQKGIPGWIKPQDIPDFWQGRHKGKGALTLGGADEGVVDVEDAGATLQQGRDQAAKPNLREWCEAYCRAPGLLREFHLTTGLYGWDCEGVTKAITGAILSTGHPANHLTVSWDVSPHTVIVRPDNVLSRALGNRCFTWGGAPYDVAYVSYGMKFYPPLPSTYPGEDMTSAQDRLAALYKLHPELPENPTLQYGPKGVHYLVGRKEGEWFREWEERIRMGVRTKFQGELRGGSVEVSEAAVGLDGY